MNSNSTTSEPAEAAMQALHHKFVNTLEFRLLDIENAAQHCRKNPSRQAFQDLAALVHKLAGVAASFGFEDMGKLSGSIDTLASRGLAGQLAAGWENTVLEEVERLLDNMEAALDDE